MHARMPLFDSITLLHNPRCSKSRAAKALLDQRGVAYRERLYLDEPLTAAELAELRKRLDRPAREWLRAGESAFREAGLAPGSADGEILAAMARFPVLIERPILIARERAVIGRPPERIADLLDDQADDGDPSP
jgi:arsenate reductase